MTSITKIGLLSGFLFFAHAMIPFSHAWPLVWPLLGGVAAVYLVSQRGGAQSFWKGLSASAKVGFAAAAFFFVATAAALFILGQPSFEPVAKSLGAEGGVAVSAPILLSLAFAALIGMAVAMVSGALTYPLVRPKNA